MSHGGRLAAKALKAAGVECVFTFSGGHVMGIYDGCLDEGIRVIDVRHEQAATHAADAWARLNPGRVGVAILTAGPGVTDGVTGVANAWRANSPILVIGGQGPFNNLRRGSLQEMDHVSLMRPITKWADACYETARIGEYIEVGIRNAMSGVPGPPSSRSRWTSSTPRSISTPSRSPASATTALRPPHTSHASTRRLRSSAARRGRWSWRAPHSSGRRADRRCDDSPRRRTSPCSRTAWAAGSCR